jgi:hypothetical protein
MDAAVVHVEILAPGLSSGWAENRLFHMLPIQK